MPAPLFSLLIAHGPFSFCISQFRDLAIRMCIVQYFEYNSVRGEKPTGNEEL